MHIGECTCQIVLTKYLYSWLTYILCSINVWPLDHIFYFFFQYIKTRIWFLDYYRFWLYLQRLSFCSSVRLSNRTFFSAYRSSLDGAESERKIENHQRSNLLERFTIEKAKLHQKTNVWVYLKNDKSLNVNFYRI